MTAAISGGLGLIGGLFGGAPKPAGPGIAPLMYQIGGQQQQQAAGDEANYLSKESSMAYEQSLLEAAQVQYQAKSTEESQALKFASSGVTLQGSPLGVIQETRALAQQEADAILKRGSEQSNLFEMQGLQMLRQGSNSAFNGFAQSLQSQWDSKVQAYQASQSSFQSGISGLRAGISGLGSLFGGGGGGGAGGGGGGGGGFTPGGFGGGGIFGGLP